MFDLVKQQVNLLKEVEKDLGVTFKQSGEKNWKIEDKELEACPFCSHHDCFSLKHEETSPENSFYKCFSCGQKGDVITWRAKRKGISVGEAVKELANDYGIRLPSSYNPIQQVFNLAADYYHQCLIETCDKPYPVLNGLTPIRYQTEIRGHTQDILSTNKIGFSDGGLLEYLESVGIDQEIVEKSGLKNLKTGKDFLPANCFIYPHFIKGRVSHFTFKDPLKRLQYQLPKKYSLNGYLFYGQDALSSDSTIILVEGENDRLSLLRAGLTSVAAIIGQISADQIEWLKNHCKDKKILTIFDPDDAGDGYRKKLEAVKKNFKGLVHVRPPEDKDIDEHVRAGAVIADLIKANVVNVVLEEKKLSTKAEDVLWSEIVPKPDLIPNGTIVENGLSVGDTFQVGPGGMISEGMHVTGPALPTVQQAQAHRLPTEFGSAAEEESFVEEGVMKDDGYIIQRRTHYAKVREVKDRTIETRISDFTMKLLNIYLDDDREQWREVVLIREDGFQSEPFLVNSETKVTVKLFKIMVARYGDCEWSGREQDLDGVWRLVYNKFTGSTIKIASQVGRYEPQKCWIFKNLLITDSGVCVEPDANGVFWPSGAMGIKPESISSTEGYDGIPSLQVGLSREETENLLGEAVKGMAMILKDPGAALMAVGWIQSNVYSNSIFKFNGGMGSLMFWGIAGKGKSTLARWLQNFFGFRDKMASTSVQQLRSGIGFMRKAEYYASLPLFLDELRADEESSRHLGTIRSWYDREGRTIADKNDAKKIRNQKINATLMIAGEDLPEDPATKERCIMIRVPNNDTKDPVLQKNYDNMENLSEKFSNITYYWIIDSCRTDHRDVMAEIRKLDSVLVSHGCSNRISKVWSGAAYFAKQLADKYFPEYDFIGYLVKTSVSEHNAQKNDNTLARFIDYMEQLKGRVNSVLDDGHISRDAKDPNLINIWYSAVFKEVNDSIRDERQRFSKHAILRAFREEPYFVSDDRRVTMGLLQDRRTVLTLDLSKAPFQVQSLVGYDK